MRKLFKSFLIIPLAFSMCGAQASYENTYCITSENQKESCGRSERIASIVGALGVGTTLGVLIYMYPELFEGIIFGFEKPQHYHYCCDRFRIFNTVIENCYPCYESNQIIIRW